MPSKKGGKKSEAPEVVEVPLPAGGDNADVMKALQERLGQMVLGGSGGVDLTALPEVIIKRLKAVESLQDEYDELHKAHLAELTELEKKYQNLYTPLFQKRKDIVTGAVDPADAPAAAASAESASTPAPAAGVAPPPPGAPAAADASATAVVAPPPVPGAAPAAPAAPIVGVPGFWAQAIKNHPDLGDLVLPPDEEALASLQDVSFEYAPKMDGFKLIFKFAPNAYFENTELTKEYSVDSMLRGEPSLMNIDACEIQWKAGKNLTVKRVKKKSKRGKPVFKEVKTESFFNFFSDPSEAAGMDAGGEGEDEDEDGEDVYSKIHQDFAQGLAFKDQLIPNGYKWFTGEGEDDDFPFGEDEGDDDDEDDDDEGEDDDEDDEEDEEEEADKSKKGKGKGKGKGKKKDDDDDEDDEQSAEVAKNLSAAFGSAGGKPAEGGDKPQDCKTQ